MTVVCGLPGNEAMAQRIAEYLNADLVTIECRHFPDGESYVRFEEDVDRKHVVLVCTLARPDSQILPLLFAADAARDLGARLITLVAPYLAYMRQDTRFRPGEAVSSRSFARLLSASFDRIITVSPHLHRYKALSDLYPIEAIALDAAPLLADWLVAHVERPLLIGPDSESEQWVGQVACLAGAPYIVGSKQRTGDRKVSVDLAGLGDFARYRPVIIDDVISSGATITATAQALRTAGFASVDCIAVHGLQCSTDTSSLLEHVDRLVTTDAIPNEQGMIGLSALLANAVARAPAAGEVATGARHRLERSL